METLNHTHDHPSLPMWPQWPACEPGEAGKPHAVLVPRVEDVLCPSHWGLHERWPRQPSMRCLSRVHDDPIPEARAATNNGALGGKCVKVASEPYRLDLVQTTKAVMACHTAVVQSRARVLTGVGRSVMVGRDEATPGRCAAGPCSDGDGSYCIAEHVRYRYLTPVHIFRDADAVADHCLAKLAEALRRATA